MTSRIQAHVSHNEVFIAPPSFSPSSSWMTSIAIGRSGQQTLRTGPMRYCKRLRPFPSETRPATQASSVWPRVPRRHSATSTRRPPQMILAAGDNEGGPDNLHKAADQWLYV